MTSVDIVKRNLEKIVCAFWQFSKHQKRPSNVNKTVMDPDKEHDINKDTMITVQWDSTYYY